MGSEMCIRDSSLGVYYFENLPGSKHILLDLLSYELRNVKSAQEGFILLRFKCSHDFYNYIGFEKKKVFVQKVRLKDQ